MKAKATLYTPHKAQRLVHASCLDESYLFTTAICGRQVGKTELGMNQAIQWAVNNASSNVMWVSPTEAQARKVYDNLLKTYRDAPFVASYKGSAQDIEIRFTNMSVIKFKSAKSEDNLRGETVNYMILDEAAFIKELTWTEILKPMLNVGGRKCLIISTPKGKNWLHKHYLRGMNGTKGYKSFHFTYRDNPYSNIEMIEADRENIPNLVFQQEYEGKFVDGASIIENIPELCNLKMQLVPHQGEKYYCGIDLALELDYTVVTILNDEGNLIYFDRFKRGPKSLGKDTVRNAPEMKERIVKILNLWKPENTLIETNHMGNVIIDDLKHVYKMKKINGFTTSPSSKKEIITSLINAFASKTIHCVDDERLKSELETFEMSMTPGGNIKFAASEGFHDDIVMSLAIARKSKETAVKNKFNLRINR